MNRLTLTLLASAAALPVLALDAYAEASTEARPQVSTSSEDGAKKPLVMRTRTRAAMASGVGGDPNSNNHGVRVRALAGYAPEA